MSKYKLLVLLAIILMFSIVGGGWYFCNELFPKAPTIKTPEINDISIVSVAANTDKAFAIKDVEMEELIGHIKSAEPTREQSVNDYPPTGFFRIEIQTVEKEYRYFIFERGEQVYIEIPYEGIYRVDAWLFDFVIKYFEE